MSDTQFNIALFLNTIDGKSCFAMICELDLGCIIKKVFASLPGFCFMKARYHVNVYVHCRLFVICRLQLLHAGKCECIY